MTVATVPYVFIGDDFTGASDTLATLSERNWRARLFLEVPSSDIVFEGGLDAVGIATELRSQSPVEITAQMNRLLPAISAHSPSIIHYKICSTFDSTVHTGNIATAAVLLERHFSPELTLVIGGQPSLGRYCAFGNLFARATDGQTYRIDRHPVMKRHPITPMPEADLRLHLAGQGLTGLGLISLQEIGMGADAIAVALDASVEAGCRRILLDATEEAHLESIRAAMRRITASGKPLLVIGASSVAEIFADRKPEHYVKQGTSVRADPSSRSVLIVAGSRSSVTAAQVAAAGSFRKQPIAARELLSGSGLERLSDECRTLLAAGENVLVYLLPEENYGMSGTELSLRLADFVSGMLCTVPIASLGIAGGDTSSIIARKIGVESLSFERRIGTGTAVCRACFRNGARDGLRILFKGGQVGPENVFEAFAQSRQ